MLCGSCTALARPRRLIGTNDLWIAATDREILNDAGKVTEEITKAHAETEFEKYRMIQDHLYQSDFDKQVHALETLENKSDQKSGQATLTKS